MLLPGVEVLGQGFLAAFLEREQPAICVVGHTHHSKTEWLGKTLLFNPGSAGPKRFKLPRGVGILVLARRGITPNRSCSMISREKQSPVGPRNPVRDVYSSGPADLLVKKSGNSESSFSHHLATHRRYPSRCRPLVRARGG